MPPRTSLLSSTHKQRHLSYHASLLKRRREETSFRRSASAAEAVVCCHPDFRLAAVWLLGVGWQLKFDSEAEWSEWCGLEPTAVELGDALRAATLTAAPATFVMNDAGMVPSRSHSALPRLFMIVGIPKETFPGERRVALVPAVVPSLTKAGLSVVLESQAGAAAGFPDAAYVDQDVRIVPDRLTVFRDVDVVLQVRAAGAAGASGDADLPLMRSGQALVAFLEPLIDPARSRALGDRGVTAFSMELIPRITRAQSMDALSSMATVAGYRAVLLAADRLPRMFPMLMTAAGTITPAKVFVVGAGVAGLQAIATARRLGARVEAYDVRPAVKEQVESLGASFAELPLETDGAEDAGGYAKAQGDAFYERQREMMSAVVAGSDVVITTALIPGKTAPILVTTRMIEGMAPGSVVVDLAAERGGNCEPTEPGHTVDHGGVTILGPTNLPSTVAYHASQMYAKNITTLLLHLLDDGALPIDRDDDITSGTLVTYEGQVVHERVREAMSAST